jgi:hypothetical protein
MDLKPTRIETVLARASIGCVAVALAMVVVGIWTDWRWMATAVVVLVVAGVLAASHRVVGGLIEAGVCERADTEEET